MKNRKETDQQLSNMSTYGGELMRAVVESSLVPMTVAPHESTTYCHLFFFLFYCVACVSESLVPDLIRRQSRLSDSKFIVSWIGIVIFALSVELVWLNALKHRYLKSNGKINCFACFDWIEKEKHELWYRNLLVRTSKVCHEIFFPWAHPTHDVTRSRVLVSLTCFALLFSILVDECLSVSSSLLFWCTFKWSHRFC